MKIEARFATKAPETTDGIQRVKVIVGDLEVEISVVGSTSDRGLQLRLNQPFGDAMVVIPHATNGILVFSKRL